eukprot:SAG22_NODE_5889_length_935_cov_1.612440_2_plen_108_part_00
MSTLPTLIRSIDATSRDPCCAPCVPHGLPAGGKKKGLFEQDAYDQAMFVLLTLVGLAGLFHCCGEFNRMHENRMAYKYGAPEPEPGAGAAAAKKKKLPPGARRRGGR